MEVFKFSFILLVLLIYIILCYIYCLKKNDLLHPLVFMQFKIFYMV